MPAVTPTPPAYSAFLVVQIVAVLLNWSPWSVTVTWQVNEVNIGRLKRLLFPQFISRIHRMIEQEDLDRFLATCRVEDVKMDEGDLTFLT